jgi:hypothetical protein
MSQHPGVIPFSWSSDFKESWLNHGPVLHLCFIELLQVGIVVHAYNPSSQEAEAEELL